MNEEIVQCARCGRKLKSKKAKELGYGPVCWAKAQVEREQTADQDDKK